MTTMTLLLASLIPALGPAQMSANPVDVVDAFHAALQAGDRDAVLRYLAPELVVFESGGGEMSRDEYASHHLGADMQFSASVERELESRQDDVVGDVAYVLSQTRTTGTFRDRQIDSSGVETMVLRQRDGAWRIVHIHWSSRSATPD